MTGKDNIAFVSINNGGFALSGTMETHIMSKLLIIIRRFIMAAKKILPVHPGEILLEEFLQPMNISQYRLAHDINVPPRRINEIVHGKRSITADTALRLGRYFNMSAQFWINLQSHYDLEVESDKLAGRLVNEVLIHHAA
jgi:antitoxin HigA-1